jgi:membrane-bound serine protease (ClpP class)
MQHSLKDLAFILGIETVALAGAAAALLWWADSLLDPTAWLLAGAAIVVGDVLTAIFMERTAPTKLTVGPGEQLVTQAEVLEGFADSRFGMVKVRGERWRAACASATNLPVGERVRVVDRDGLTLIVEPLDAGANVSR